VPKANAHGDRDTMCGSFSRVLLNRRCAPVDYEKMSDQEILELDISKVMGIPLQSEQGQKLLQTMGETVQDRVLDRILASLTDRQKQELDALPDDDANAMNAFLAKACPQQRQYLIEETVQLKRKLIKDYTELMAEVKKGAPPKIVASPSDWAAPIKQAWAETPGGVHAPELEKYEKMSDQEIYAFDLFSLFGFSQESMKGQEILERMAKILEERVQLRVFESLTAREKQELDEIPEDDDGTVFEAFLERACPKHAEYMIEETVRLKRENIGDFLKLKAQMDAMMNDAQKQA